MQSLRSHPILVRLGAEAVAPLPSVCLQQTHYCARKMRMMGSAALGLAYIASGRLDAYLESRISLWDVAAGTMLVEAAGGQVDLPPHPTIPDVWSVVATNGKIPIAEIL